MSTLVTGASGQLGSAIRALATELVFTDREMLDITDKDALDSFFDKHKIDAVVNCAAYTAVDGAESESEQAYLINSEALKNLAEICKKRGAKLIHISTDYVFDGKNYKPYSEEDKTNPQNVYGKSKLMGEKEMLSTAPKNSCIIRTSWVYGEYGKNFLKTMLRLGMEKESLGVVFDQIGTPTYAGDLAGAILEILPKLENATPQIYHYSNEGVCSWYDFAKEIMDLSKLDCKVNPIETHEYPTPAIRPHFSVLNKSKIKKEFGVTIPYWKDSLKLCLKNMEKNQ